MVGQYNLSWQLQDSPVAHNEHHVCSSAFKKLCSEFRIRHARTIPRNPQANTAERVIRDLRQGLCIAIEGGEEKWTSKLQQVAFALRAETNSATGFAPSELLFGMPLHRQNDIMTFQEKDAFETLPVLVTAAKNSDLLAKLRQKRKYD